MAINPLVPQGSLNRLRASVFLIDNPALNISVPYLGRAGIRMAFEGEASGYPTTMTGAVPSPAPFQLCNVTIALLKTQGLSNSYKNQFEFNTSIGDVSIQGDSVTLDDYNLSNCILGAVDGLDFSGEAPEFVVTLKGVYYINSSLFTA